jgi:osmotically-inducible protein OsmY
MRTVASAMLALALVAPLFAVACGTATRSSRTSSAAMDDGTVTARVKTVFVNDPAIVIARIDVETFKGVVTLSGRVKSKDEEAKAIALARTVKGVTDVKSKLEIQ